MFITIPLNSSSVNKTGRSISLGSNPALPLRPGSTPTPGLRYKNLGKSGLRVSNVGLGTWPVFSPGVSDDQAEAILKLAIESGINLFDISEAHSETEIGKIDLLRKARERRGSETRMGRSVSHGGLPRGGGGGAFRVGPGVGGRRTSMAF